ncbi:PHD FINGER PROTEIN MALE MEIOCYTE DEATH 1-RELATED [Salix purpurea]|uniref:PHD FINGER PROTEIN MALE MEIOCYTE DEATH 1-RELATED n=1 Tax=Salix purpurea TaxID=77065 RepID=A0A9Q0URU4_SALPP|nr:PHD FINGER PROTEIN MALE MEIOCYTE DEATH 1-RELATED [Salix purpurea]
MELEKIIQDFSDTNLSKSMKQIIHYYKDLSPIQLITFKDLLRFMLTIRSCPCVWKKQSNTSTTTSKPPINIVLRRKPLVKEKCMKYRNFGSLVGTMDSRWPTRRLQYAADACLIMFWKSMNNVVVGKYVVQRAVNPKTRILEYSIEEFGDGVIPVKSEPESETVLAQPHVPGADVNADVVYVYENVLFNYPESELVEVATQAILDCKHFVKEWPFRVENDQSLSIRCQVMPNWNDLEAKSHRKAPPGEVIVLPLHASVLELKQEAESALRDTYCMMERFRFFVKGYGMDINSQLRYEGGSDNWKVRCECGACDDDGERMVECDICEVWQHTRCNGIHDADIVPQLFICSGCCDSLLPGKTETHQKFESSDDLLMIPAAIGYGAEVAEPFFPSLNALRQ